MAGHLPASEVSARTRARGIPSRTVESGDASRYG